MSMLLACLIAATMAAVPPASNPIRVAEVARSVAAHGTAEDDRAAAEKELNGHDPVVVLRVLAAEIDGAVDGAGDSVPGYDAQKNPTAEVRAWLALHRVWDHHVWGEKEIVWVSVTEDDGTTLKHPGLKDNRSPRKKAAIGKVLTALLKDARTEHTRQLALQALRRNYSSDAEAPLAATLREEKSPETMTAAKILLEQHMEKYGPLVIDRAADPERELSWRKAYLDAIDGVCLDGLSEVDRNRLIRAGFTILAEDRGYFTACSLERLTGRRFTPDQKAAKYQGPHGLTDAFFADTVKNALAWWAASRDRYK